MPKMICKICEKEFWIKPSRIKTGRGKTCSNECSYEYGIVDDDRIENLKLFTNQSEHCKFHDSLRKRNKLGQFGNIFFCVLTGIYSPIS